VLDAFHSNRAESCLLSRPYRTRVTKGNFLCFRRRKQLIDTVIDAHMELLLDRDDAEAAVAQQSQVCPLTWQFTQ
jgi:hypothetical protein